MKAAKRPTWGYSKFRALGGSESFGDRVEHVDRIATLQSLASQLERLADLRSFQKLNDISPTRPHDEDYYRERASIYREEAKRLEELPRRERAKVLRKLSPSGAGATSKRFARPALDALIRGYLVNDKPMRDHTTRWAEEFNIGKDAVYRRIDKIRRELGLEKKKKLSHSR
jgi:hypothetical protein